MVVGFGSPMVGGDVVGIVTAVPGRGGIVGVPKITVPEVKGDVVATDEPPEEEAKSK
jgi:hypothetical protein